MPLKKILFRPGVNRENTRYASESLGMVSAGTESVGGWYESDKMRFRQGTPEKIGGWTRISTNFFAGLCTSLWNWVTLGGANLIGVGTDVKFYIEFGGVYNDITPLRKTTTLTNPFTVFNLSTTVQVLDVGHGCVVGDYVTFSGASLVGGEDLNGEYRVAEVLSVNVYTIVAGMGTITATGGGTVTAQYQIHIGSQYVEPKYGWGAGVWGAGGWGVGDPPTYQLRLWSQSNFGENLIFGPRGGGIYYWTASGTTFNRAVELSTLLGTSGVPVIQNYLLVSDASRFVFAFGCNDYSSSDQNPMLLRWSDQEDPTQWTPSATNQAGSLLLSHGSEIVTAIQTRQEILVFTDSSLYSLQYYGAPTVWGSQLLGDNISIVGQNAAAQASGVTYWMGVDKFYKYDGRVQTLRCDLRQYVYGDINLDQSDKFFASTNEGFNEVWFFYCSASSRTIDRYVVYNYFEGNGAGVWYYGNMARTAWLDSGLRNYPLAATMVNNLVNHELGVDDNTTEVPAPIAAVISSSEFDIDDGHNFGFVRRILPDLTFRGSTGSLAPQVTMTLIPLANSGAGYNNPTSEGGSNSATVQRSTTVPVEEFTGQVFIRVRGRQMVFRVESNQLGTAFQIGAPRIDLQADGRRGNS